MYKTVKANEVKPGDVLQGHHIVDGTYTPDGTDNVLFVTFHFYPGGTKFKRFLAWGPDFPVKVRA